MIDYRTLLQYIDPDESYENWIQVGMALKHEGQPYDLFEVWSSNGEKYKVGECQKKWDSFNERQSGPPVTGGTIYNLAVKGGYKPPEIADYDIHNLLLDEVQINTDFAMNEKVPEPQKKYDPKADMLEYFTEIYKPTDHVGLALSFMERDGRTYPAKTNYRRTAGDIIEKLKSGTIESALGKMDRIHGAYIRPNPLDGKGESDSNVSSFNYCLIECDDANTPRERQFALIKALNLPVKFVIWSGGKSLHAITHVDAFSYPQYQERVQKLYQFCLNNNFKIDTNNKNASRFSRLPGVNRGDDLQYIVDRNIGPPSFDAWLEWVEEQADDLPQEINLGDVYDHLRPLKEELIPGVLRVGHKLLLSGPSKAGKSFLLINLAISIAEGVEWLGMVCKQGKVIYINLELDGDSCLHRFKDIYEKRHLIPKHLNDITIWNLRGYSVPLEKLVPPLVRRFKDKHISAVIIDPIYKVLGDGDENNAGDMARFCNQFDKIAVEMQVATIYCHHHSKGAAAKYSNAAERSSGSGVFARDPDAILDLTELNIDGHDMQYREIHPDACEVVTGWEMRGTLREFPEMKKKRLWFDYPVHRFDTENFLATCKYSDLGRGGTGVGDDQVPTEVRIANAEDLLTNGVTAVKCDELGTSKNWSRIYGRDTDFETCTLNGSQCVIRRGAKTVELDGIRYNRVGSSRKWIVDLHSIQRT